MGLSPFADRQSVAGASAFIQQQNALVRERVNTKAPLALPVPAVACDQAEAAALVDFCHALGVADRFERMWMESAGIKCGQIIGATDEIGLRAIEKRAHVRDIHATILRLMGLNQFKTAYKHNGRMEVPALVEGRVIRELVS